jgi:putative cardiolipin synthase
LDPVTHMVSDDPAKGLGLAAPEALLTERLRLCVGEPASRLTLVWPYFVPLTTEPNRG